MNATRKHLIEWAVQANGQWAMGNAVQRLDNKWAVPPTSPKRS